MIFLNNCDGFGVSVGTRKCCGGLFADDIVLITPLADKLRDLLLKVYPITGRILIKCLLVSKNVQHLLLSLSVLFLLEITLIPFSTLVCTLYLRCLAILN